ncbi:uncharacterized protein si:ch211-199g17.2 [Pimephales promelas]|uniref:uncharacterized protein si:ch211-199g17.2 n=1 Tax=Pimephales promelas TaxID=90988 RepID=UPI0019558609|nr:uncharacterized protein si:ch211-199g17.2 [Pimephales promelas]XP_039536414.1 uncharacterized protein si:ch211-199g17.2 [Pimephales promelas]XP_039536415.1 uncharacterized protein si:ch211-199g17.2 [Pimephales promelas]
MLSSSSSAGCQSQLYNAIRSYLHNQNREQPIIGLNSITEVLTHCQPALYFCDVCFLRITKPDIRNHIMGSIHRYNYIKYHHACGWRAYTDLSLLARPLMDIAKMVEKREGTGDVQVLCVDEVIYNMMTSLPVTDAFAQMTTIKNQRNCPSEGQRESGYTDGTAQLLTSGCSFPTQSVSTTPNMIEPQTVSTNPTSNASPPRTAGPVKPLLGCQEASTHQSLVDSHFSSTISCLESAQSPAFSQHINQDQPLIADRNQSLQQYVMPSENYCLTETRTIAVVRPPRQWSPIRFAFQNDTLHASEEHGNNVMHSFGVSYETHPLHLAQTPPYEAQWQTPAYQSNMVPEITQSLTSRHRFFINESSSDSPEPARNVPITSVINLVRAQTLTKALEPAATHDSNPWKHEANPKKPIVNRVACVDAQSDNFEEGDVFLFSQNPIAQSPLAQTQSSSDPKVESLEDFLENYKGRKPLVGLQAVIKCQSVDGYPPPCCYLCQLCALKLNKKNIFRHLTSFDHRRNYLKVLHPQLLPIKRKHCNTNEMLEDIATQLEKEDGRGQIKVMRLSACLISDVLLKDYQWCMNVLNCGAGVEWRSDLLSFKDRTNKTTGSSQTLKRPAESLLPPSDKWPIKAPDGPPTHQMAKKMKNGHPKHVMSTNKVKNPVFKVSLSLLEGPVVIERTSLRDTVTVAPEIEGQSRASTCVDDVMNTHPEGRPHTIHCENTQQYPEGDLLAQMDIPTHTEVVSHTDSRMFEDQSMNPAQYAYSGQFDQSQGIQKADPYIRPNDCGAVEEVVPTTYADWPGQDWSFYNNEWIAMRQNQYGSDHSWCEGYMRY